MTYRPCSLEDRLRFPGMQILVWISLKIYMIKTRYSSYIFPHFAYSNDILMQLRFIETIYIKQFIVHYQSTATTRSSSFAFIYSVTVFFYLFFYPLAGIGFLYPGEDSPLTLYTWRSENTKCSIPLFARFFIVFSAVSDRDEVGSVSSLR